MELFFRSPKSALSGPFGELSFAELGNLVQAEKASLGNGLARLDCSMEIPFVARLIAHLEAGVPVALFAAELSPGEIAQRERLLQNPLHPETAAVVFTSGSSGEPKAVQLSRKNIEANTAAVCASLRFAQAPRQSLFLSLSYSYGLFGQLLPALREGIPTVLYPKFVSVAAAFAAGKGEGMWSGVPSHWEALLRVTKPEQTKGVTHVISAGAPLSLSLRRRLSERFPHALLFNNYGLTEASPRVLSLPSDHPRFFEEETVGLPVPGIDVSLDDKGQLLVRGPQVMLGYLGELGTSRIENSWLASGDGAEIDPEGVVRIKGRLDELFNVGGERCSPLEIDAALSSAPGVREAAVKVGRDPIYGVKLTGFLVPKPGEALERGAILAHLKQHLSGGKIPSTFFQVESLPRTANGKLRRGELGGGEALR